jgi:hypothetical protein
MMFWLRRFSDDVRVWQETDMPKYLGDVRCWVNSGKHLLSLSFFPVLTRNGHRLIWINPEVCRSVSVRLII